MAEQQKRLVGRNTIDGLLHSVGEDQWAEASLIAEECGYDVKRPHAFYSVEVLVCITRQLANLLYPTADEGEAQFMLGTVSTDGYAASITGMMTMSKQRTMKIGEIIEQILSLTQREMPFTQYTVRELAQRKYSITLTGWPLHPNFLAGGLLAIIANNGAQNPTYTVEAKDEMDYVYLFSWVG